MTQFNSYLTQSKEEISKYLNKHFDDFTNQSTLESPHLTQFINPLKTVILDGKKVRGTLVKIGFELSGGKDNEAVFDVASAIELLHAGFLIHDDIIDNTTTRRGEKTIHEYFGGKRYGKSLALCIGDVTFFWASSIIAKANIPSEIKVQILSHFSKISVKTCFGQILDISSNFRSVTEETIKCIHKLKTAYYTFSGPLIMGAIFGNSKTPDLNLLQKFGDFVGLSYQIHDDKIGLFGSENVTGKSTISDIHEGKSTYLILKALEKANAAEKQMVLDYYGNYEVSLQTVEKIKNIVEKTGSLQFSIDEEKKYLESASNLIPKITPDPIFRTLLGDLLSYLSSRKN